MSKKVAVIVGAGPGLSLAIADKFGTEGYRIALVSRNQRALEELAASLAAKGIEAYPIPADASDSASVQSAFRKIKAECGQPEVLVYNAAVIKLGTASALTATELMDDLNVNVVGALRSALEIVPELIERRSGTILFTGGGLALNPSSQLASLSIGKSALRSLAYSLGEELASHGVYVGTVTIDGSIEKNGRFDPELIARIYWDMHVERTRREVVYQ